VGHFLLQKALVIPRRQAPSQRDKDAAYIFAILDSAHGLVSRALDDLERLLAMPREAGRALAGLEEIERTVQNQERLEGVWQQIAIEQRPPKRFIQEEIRRFLTEMRRRIEDA
jgi:hypothetical protein